MPTPASRKGTGMTRQMARKPLIDPLDFMRREKVRETIPGVVARNATPTRHYDTRRIQCVLCGNVPKHRHLLDLETMTCQASKACADRMRDGGL
jgi:hypothetical protein